MEKSDEREAETYNWLLMQKEWQELLDELKRGVMSCLRTGFQKRNFGPREYKCVP